MTGEHIWSDWYNNQQPPEYRYELEAQIEGGEVERRTTDSLNLKPLVLCLKNKCNESWGSKLEDRVGPILTPMIRGETHRLKPADCDLISGWFFLKCMVSEYLTRRDHKFFTLEDGKHLRATLQPPDLTRIWIGRYVGQFADAGWIMDRGSARQVSDDPPAGVFWHSVTYSIGQVALHLLSLSRPIPLGGQKEGNVKFSFPWRKGDWSRALFTIWPPPRVPLAWPPEKAFDDEGFHYLTDRWLEEPPGAEPQP